MMTRLYGTTKSRLQAETMSKWWFNSSKKQKLHEVIHALCVPARENGPPNKHIYEKNSEKMSELACDYHENLQHDRPDVPKETRDQEIAELLDDLKARATENHREVLSDPLTREDIAEALKASDSETTAGTDGLTYKLLKMLVKKHQQDMGVNIRGFDILEAMRRVFKDIEDFGSNENAHFSDRWMCPLYKKKRLEQNCQL